jgi:hypothetical protein
MLAPIDQEGSGLSGRGEMVGSTGASTSQVQNVLFLSFERNRYRIGAVGRQCFGLPGTGRPRVERSDGGMALGDRLLIQTARGDVRGTTFGTDQGSQWVGGLVPQTEAWSEVNGCCSHSDRSKDCVIVVESRKEEVLGREVLEV